MFIGQLKSMIRAGGFAWRGLVCAARQERAFRQELFFFVPGTVVAAAMARDLLEFALLVLPFVFVLTMELVNSAIEAAIDRFGGEQHPLSGAAKDYAAAACMLSQATALVIWLAYFYNRLF